MQIDKPKLSAKQLVDMMKGKGILFNLISEDKAETFLKEANNYFRVASYRKNFDKYQMGKNKGEYIQLDFAYLIELSTIDMHLRYLLMKMSLDIEHSIKVKLLYNLSTQTDEDGYEIVSDFLNCNQWIIDNIARKSHGAYCGHIIQKYFNFHAATDKDTQITDKNPVHRCPAWVLLEIISFGDFLKFYEYYYKKHPTSNISIGILNAVKNLRNACAHNNCIINNLRKGDTKPNKEIVRFVNSVSELRGQQLKNKLSTQSLYEIISLLYVYSKVVSSNVRKPRIDELKKLVNERMTRNKDYFECNQILSTSYNFLKKVVDFLS